MMADEVKEIIKKTRRSSGYRSHVTKFTRLALDFQMLAVSVLANFSLDWPEHLECLGTSS